MENLLHAAPMLAEPIDDADALRILEAGSHFVEQKLDGVRLTVVTGPSARGIKRNGEKTLVPPAISKAFTRCVGVWVFDGELVGGKFWVFDLPQAIDQVHPQHPYELRRQVLDQLWPTLEMPDVVQLLPYATNKVDGLELATRVRKAGGEGVMLKDPKGTYVFGKRSRNVLKWKFWKTIDCFVDELWREGKHSVAVGVMDEDGAKVDVGSVTMTEANLGLLEEMDVIEVRYLYANSPDEPRLYQPSFLRKRDDKAPHECTLDQLEFTSKAVQT